MRRTLRSTLGAVISVSILVPAVAAAHARLVRSQPASRASLGVPPKAVRLWFNEAIEPAFARVSVTDANGKSVGEGEAQVASDDPKELMLGLGPLDAGKYQVTFEVLSVDGHRVKQTFSFSVKASAPATKSAP